MRPDLILLQEMDPDGSAAIARDLGFHHVYAPAVVHSHHGRQFGQAILSPWPLRDAEIVHLPHAHPVNGQRRIALLATADVAGREVRAGSVHTETALLAASLRAEQVVTALDAFADWDGPVVLGGDFNTVTAANVRDLARLGRSAGFDRLDGLRPHGRLDRRRRAPGQLHAGSRPHPRPRPPHGPHHPRNAGQRPPAAVGDLSTCRRSAAAEAV